MVAKRQNVVINFNVLVFVIGTLRNFQKFYINNETEVR